MKLSQLFTKVRKEDPSHEESTNAKLLIKWGFVYKEMAWVYTFLPLGLRVLNKIENIIRKHMDTVWTEMLMTALAPKENREATGRIDTVDVLMKTSGANEISKNKSNNEYILNCTHEDMITPIVKSYVNSYKDLPVTVYQIQNKFRNEARAKSGIMRGREFRMKDLYSFHPDQDSFAAYYEQVKQVYVNIFEELWIGEDTYITLASGGDFTPRYSHEFQTVVEVWEDIIYIDKTTKQAINEEVWNDDTRALFTSNTKFEKVAASEVGNIFPLESRFSNALDFTYVDANNTKQSIVMGSYGIGPSRTMWVIVEKFNDEKGIVWPENIAPFIYVIIPIGETAMSKWLELYSTMRSQGIDVAIDDRTDWPWSKFKDADLIGYPYQIVISDKTLELGEDMVELIIRKTWKKEMISNWKMLDFLKDINQWEITTPWV